MGYDLPIGEARQLWVHAIRKKGWEGKKLARVMFEDAATVGSTRYRPAPPAWRTVADPSNPDMGSRGKFGELVADLLAQGGKKSREGVQGRVVPAAPLPISEDDVVQMIQDIAREVHTGHVPHEQVLRAVFMARLPTAYAHAIGTPKSAVHAERKTPSTYRVKAKQRSVKARYDLGFGHPTRDDEISGVVELKVLDSLDELLPIDGGLLQDFLKLLDGGLPPASFRISWALSKRRASEDALPRVLTQFDAVLKIVESTRILTGRKIEVDPATGWLDVCWADGPRLRIAWYEPAGSDASHFAALTWPLLAVPALKRVPGPPVV